MNDTPALLSRNLKAYRHALGLTQEQFAERARITYKHYQDIEGGRRNNLQLKTLDRIADAIGIRSGELLSEQTQASFQDLRYRTGDEQEPLKAAEDAAPRARRD